MIHISNLRGMTDRWNLFWFHLHKVLCVVLMIHLISNECLSINLEGLALLEFRSRVESDPFGALQNWNPSDDNPCKWTGVRCVDRKVITLSLKELSLHGILTLELEKLSNLRALLLCHNKFQGSTPLIENPKMHFDLMHDQNLSCGMTNELGRVNRKVKHCFWKTGWHKLKNVNSFLFRLKRRIIQIFEISPLRVLLSIFRSKGGIWMDRMKEAIISWFW